MPNHTSNYIIFNETLSKEEVNKIKKSLFDKTNNLDFNKLIPQPTKIIKVSINKWIIEAYSWYFFKNPDKLSKEELEKTLSNEKAGDEIEKKYNLLSKEIKENIKKEEEYEELPNWFDWNIKNWGTKWGAYNTEFDEGNVLFFNTAWNRPKDEVLNKLFEELEKILPKDKVEKISYEVEYEGETIREFYKFISGKIKLVSSENIYEEDEEYQ